MGLFRKLWAWIDSRTGLSTILRPLTEHDVPPETTKGAIAWMYVLGAATLFAFVLQVTTGVVLATKYIPSTAHAYESIQFITREVPLGGLLRGMHFFGASAMVLFVFLHMVRVFLTGSYKFPREISWMTGVVLFGLTMAMAFTGQLLRWDENGVWTVVVAAYFAGRVPLIGDGLAQFILAGPAIGGSTLSRFFALHVFGIPLLIMAFVGLHLFLVLHNGISEAPKPGQPVDPKTYRDRFRAYLERHGGSYWPDAAWKEIIFGVAMVLVIVGLAVIFGPRQLGAEPDPVRVVAIPQPDWFLIWYYALLYVKPRELAHLFMVYLPLAVPILLLLLPIVASRGERSPLRRPWAVIAVGVVSVALIALTELGLRAPWIPEFDTQPLTAEALGVEGGPVLLGAQLFYERGCQYCHTVAGRGGEYGPDLTDVAKRVSPEEITVRIVNGLGRDMPAYRHILDDSELDAIVVFLSALAEDGVGPR